MPEAGQKVAQFISLDSPEGKLPMVCERALHSYEQGRTVAVRVASRPEAERLDDLMWTFKDRSFIPHALAAEAEEPVLEAVLIYCEGEEPGEANVLIHAAGGEPDEALTRFPRVLDFAEVYDDELREAGRRRFAACREAGYRMRYVK
ncbi:MAG: DNA polymerase III subunit chi [Candidatus Brocadiia bacterium]|jgi:DNA polymerase-3 subunit chi|nr:DNA polymerase III subunit chi [Candidatus Brocadiia bacterium]